MRVLLLLPTATSSGPDAPAVYRRVIPAAAAVPRVGEQIAVLADEVDLPVAVQQVRFRVDTVDWDLRLTQPRMVLEQVADWSEEWHTALLRSGWRGIRRRDSLA